MIRPRDFTYSFKLLSDISLAVLAWTMLETGLVVDGLMNTQPDRALQKRDEETPGQLLVARSGICCSSSGSCQGDRKPGKQHVKSRLKRYYYIDQAAMSASTRKAWLMRIKRYVTGLGEW